MDVRRQQFVPAMPVIPVLKFRLQKKKLMQTTKLNRCSPGMSEIAIREKINGTGRDGTRLNGNGIGLENTVDYRS